MAQIKHVNNMEICLYTFTFYMFSHALEERYITKQMDEGSCVAV